MFKPFEMTTEMDKAMLVRYLGSLDRPPDLIIAPDGEPYLYRWHLLKGDKEIGSVYFHMQVADDPERPLHDHPWDNMSVILAGGYVELLQKYAPAGTPELMYRKKGDVIFRRAHEAHRLLMPASVNPSDGVKFQDPVDYTLTQFTTGPKIKEWGFWYPHGFVPYTQVTELLADGRSVHKGKLK